MRQWKDQGIVQDSDDEVDDLDLEDESPDELAEDHTGEQRSQQDASPSTERHAPVWRPESQESHGSPSLRVKSSHGPAERSSPTSNRPPNDAHHYSHKSLHDTTPRPTSDDYEPQTLLNTPKKSSESQRTTQSSPKALSSNTNIPEVDDLLRSPQSPLTELQSSQRTASQPVPLSESSITACNPVVLINAPSADVVQHITSQELHEDEIARAGGRSLRHRNPIQLHPYLLENEAYRNSLRARGLRPVQVARELQQNTAPLHDSFQDSFRDQDEEANQYLHSSQQQQSSPFLDSLSTGQQRSLSSNTDEDDLPPLNDLVHASGHQLIRQGHKRRKIGHASQLAGIESARRHAFIGDNSLAPRSPAQGDRDIFDIGQALQDFDGGETEQSHPVRRRRKKFRVPRTLAEDSLPTPAASSELSRTRRGTMESSSHSGSEPSGTPSRYNSLRRTPGTTERQRGRSNTIVVTSGSSSSEEVVTHHQHDTSRQFQKKIKGVLPASWLRLDQGPKVSSRSTAAARPRSPHLSPQKGIARRVSTSNARNNSTITSPIRHGGQSLQAFESASEEDVALPINDQDTTAVPDASLHDYRFLVPDDAGSVVEEDFIDPMLPIEPRQRRIETKKRRKRQSRLDDAFVGAERTNRATHASSKSAASHHNQSRRTDAKHTGKHRKQWVRRKLLPKRSILDVTSHGAAGGEPNFVKLAKRQARQERNLGRQSPGRKQLSLQTQQDGDEVDLVLRDWKAGRIRPSSHTQKHRQQSSNSASLQLDAIEQPSYHVDDKSVLSRHTLASAPAKSELSANVHARKPRQKKLNIVPIVTISDSDTPWQSSARQRNAQKVQPPSLKQQPSASRRHLGQLEELEADNNEKHADYAFRRDLLKVNKRSNFVSRQQANEAAAPLERFLAESDKENEPAPTGDDNIAISITHPTEAVTVSNKRVKVRKRRPQRIHQDQLEFHRLRNDDVFEESPSPQSSTYVSLQQQTRVKGLLPYGSSYTADFGISPLPTGVCFRSRSLIGSGELAQALRPYARDLSDSTGNTIIYCGDLRYRLGAWNEESSANYQSIVAQSVEAVTSRSGDTLVDSAIQSLRSLIRYLNDYISFSDSVDKRSFVSVAANTLQLAVTAVARDFDEPSQPTLIERTNRILLYLTVISAQACRIAKDPVVSGPDQTVLQNHKAVLASYLASALFSRTNHALLEFHDVVSIRVAREFGIRDTDGSIESTVALYHVVRGSNEHQQSFWKIFEEALSKQLPQGETDIQAMETVWHQLFAVLPLLEIDRDGLLKPGERREADPQVKHNWTIAKDLLTRTLALAETATHHPTLNAYIRAILTRCFRLVRVWAWYNSESVLGCAYDFFAKRGYALLATEESNGSAKFLEQLHDEQIPQVDASDRSFQIFLKMLAVGLIEMRNVYPDKKIRNLAWRFVPNHGRSYHKDEGLRQADLDALRNHHDLLCVLYYASPALARPSLTPLRNLVDFKTSHAEVCKVGVRAWANLTRFQTSTAEKSDAVSPFVSWFDDIVDGCAFQHRLAQTEAEAVANNRTSLFSWEVLHANVAKNQAEVENILVGLLDLLTDILHTAKNLEATRRLFDNIKRSAFSELDRSSSTRSHKISTALIAAYQAYLDLLDKQHPSTQVLEGSEDSQDYGDLDLDDVDNVTSNEADAQPHLAIMADELWDLIQASCLPQSQVTEPLLEGSIVTYVKAISHLVKHRQKDWLDYLDSNGSCSWHRLSEADQRRKYGPLFFASILSQDQTVVKDHSKLLMCAWMECLVERDALLKYQHRLTSALLNTESEHPVLQNLPFATDAGIDMYAVSLDEIRSRRISLLSTVLSNIRKAWEDSWFAENNRLGQQRRDTCVALLKTLMSAMKRNYQEIQPDASNRSAYVDFVQAIVQLMLQYTPNPPIVPIDKFFTDSAAFPLPTADPYYVVGRLRRYEHGAGLADEGKQKQLVKFVQALVERASAEDQQGFLTEQLVSATHADTRIGGPSLWAVFIGIIAPAYVRVSMQDLCHTFVTSPVIHAATTLLRTILNGSAIGDNEFLRSTLPPIITLLTAAIETMRSRASPDRGRANLCALIMSAIPLIDLLIRRTDDAAAHQAWRVINSVAKPIRSSPTTNTPFSPVYKYAQHELASAIASNWTLSQEGWVQPKRNGRRIDVRDRERDGSFLEAFAALRREVEGVGMRSWKKDEIEMWDEEGRKNELLAGVFV